MDIAIFQRLRPMILYVVLDCDGYYHVPRIMTRDSLSPFLGPWWILSFSKDYDLCFLYVVSDCDRYYHFPMIMTRDSFIPFPRLWRVLPYICNIVFLSVLNTSQREVKYGCIWQVWGISLHLNHNFFLWRPLVLREINPSNSLKLKIDYWAFGQLLWLRF
jgi:hypothetical protein